MSKDKHNLRTHPKLDLQEVAHKMDSLTAEERAYIAGSIAAISAMKKHSLETADHGTMPIDTNVTNEKDTTEKGYFKETK
ncbi:hypothetical protein [Intestinibacillus massiliensis]